MKRNEGRGGREANNRLWLAKAAQGLGTVCIGQELGITALRSGAYERCLASGVAKARPRRSYKSHCLDLVVVGPPSLQTGAASGAAHLRRAACIDDQVTRVEHTRLGGKVTGHHASEPVLRRSRQRLGACRTRPPGTDPGYAHRPPSGAGRGIGAVNCWVGGPRGRPASGRPESRASRAARPAGTRRRVVAHIARPVLLTGARACAAGDLQHGGPPAREEPRHRMARHARPVLPTGAHGCCAAGDLHQRRAGRARNVADVATEVAPVARGTSPTSPPKWPPSGALRQGRLWSGSGCRRRARGAARRP